MLFSKFFKSFIFVNNKKERKHIDRTAQKYWRTVKNLKNVHEIFFFSEIKENDVFGVLAEIKKCKTCKNRINDHNASKGGP